MTVTPCQWAVLRHDTVHDPIVSPVDDATVALEEMYRVLRRGGTALVLDLRKDVTMSEIRNSFRAIGLSTVERWMTLTAFRFMLLKRAYTRAQLKRMLADIPFRRKEVRLVDVGVELWLQK